MIPADGPVVVPLHSRRLERAEALMAAVDGVSAITLALEARQRLERGGGGAALGWAELAVAALLAIATVGMLRGRRHLGRWVGALAGVVMLLEGLAKTYGPKGHPSWALTLNGLVLLAVAALAPALERRRARLRALTLRDSGLSYRRGLFRRFSVPLEQIERVVLGAATGRVCRRDGRNFHLHLADLHNRASLETALRAWTAAKGIELVEAPDHAAAPKPPAGS